MQQDISEELKDIIQSLRVRVTIGSTNDGEPLKRTYKPHVSAQKWMYMNVRGLIQRTVQQTLDTVYQDLIEQGEPEVISNFEKGVYDILLDEDYYIEKDTDDDGNSDYADRILHRNEMPD